jgi:hypothetical protein
MTFDSFAHVQGASEPLQQIRIRKQYPIKNGYVFEVDDQI